jgi:hypothetical protein
MQTAVADIIDNSITAKARQIWIRFNWNNGNPWIAVVDNGCGMSRDQLINAMRFGSVSPLEKRHLDDLGRFGLGLKTASFSQCRHLTVLSKQDTLSSCFEWDLEQITTEWTLGEVSGTEMHAAAAAFGTFTNHVREHESGTLVLWRKLDRIAQGELTSTREEVFNAIVYDVRKHLEFVFHRFLLGEGGAPKTLIEINGDALTGLSPFNSRNRATQELPEQTIVVDTHAITAQPYILPHHSKVTQDEYQRYAGEGGYLHNQGFYVYRNRRLIIWGTWFRLIKKQELTKLIRVRVDIPNTLDHLWEIDVKKSHASPPERVKKELRQVIERIEYSGKRVYKQRGVLLKAKAAVPAWNRIATNQGIHYEINRNHPLLDSMLRDPPTPNTALLQDLLKILESTFPQELYYNDMAENPEDVSNSNIEAPELEKILGRFLEFYSPSGALNNQQVEDLLAIEPFASQRELTLQLLSTLR